MVSHRSVLILVAGLLAAVSGVSLPGGAVGAASAQAQTYCAPGPCGEGIEVATIAEAVEMADANGGPDVVAIQPGTYETPNGPCGGLFVEQEDTHVRGAGIDQTVLTFPPLEPTDGFTRRVICGHMHLSDLTLRLPSDVTPEHNSSVEGLDLYSGVVERVKVDALGATFGPDINDGHAEAMLLREGAARDIEVALDPTLDTEGIQTGYLTELRNLTVRVRGSALSSRVAQEPGDPPMRVSRVVLQGNRPLSVANESGLDSRMELTDALLDASATPPGEYSSGVSVYNGLPPNSAELAMDHVTIVGNGGPESFAMEVGGEGGPKPTVLEARHVIATGFSKTILFGRYGSDVKAAIDYSNLDLSLGAIAEEGTEGTVTTAFGPGNRAGSPLFIAPASGDYRLALGSPAIDIGGADLVTGEPTDLAGTPRPQDGDGDGVALLDAGAFEHGAVPVRSKSTPDRTVKVEILGKRLRLSRSGAARLRLRCFRDEQSPPCRGKVTLRTKGKVDFSGKRRRVVLAKGRFSIAAGHTVSIPLALSPAKAGLLRSDPRARQALVTAQVGDGAGNRATNRKPMRITPSH